MRRRLTERTHPVAMHLGRRLGVLREKAGLSREELAARASLPRSEISILEGGELATRLPRLDVLMSLADALGLAPEALLERVNWSAGAAEAGAEHYVGEDRR